MQTPAPHIHSSWRTPWGALKSNPPRGAGCSRQACRQRNPHSCQLVKQPASLQSPVGLRQAGGGGGSRGEAAAHAARLAIAPAGSRRCGACSSCHVGTLAGGLLPPRYGMLPLVPLPAHAAAATPWNHSRCRPGPPPEGEAPPPPPPPHHTTHTHTHTRTTHTRAPERGAAAGFVTP